MRIQVWQDATNILIENNRVWQIYDVGLDYETPVAAAVTNIAFQNNVVWDCGLADCDFTLVGSTSTCNGFDIENNTLVDAGYGWAQSQRTDTVGWDLGFNANQASTTTNFYVRNNICSGALHADLYVANNPWTNINALTLDYNLYYQPNSAGLVADWFAGSSGGGWYNTANFVNYQSASGKDAHSIVGLPQFVDPEIMITICYSIHRRSTPARIPASPPTTTAPPGPRAPLTTSAPTNIRPCPW